MRGLSDISSGIGSYDGEKIFGSRDKPVEDHAVGLRVIGHGRVYQRIGFHPGEVTSVKIINHRAVGKFVGSPGDSRAFSGYFGNLRTGQYLRRVPVVGARTGIRNPFPERRERRKQGVALSSESPVSLDIRIHRIPTGDPVIVSGLRS